MQSSSSIAATASVLRTLWTQGTCLSPMPSMRWPPKPFMQQRRALQRLGGDDLAGPDAGS